MSKKSAVIPAYNEANAIGGVIEALFETTIIDEVIVVDDCSTDETAARVAETEAVLLSNEQNRHVGGATKRGCQEAIARGADVLFRLDGDGQHDPAELHRMDRVLQSSECQYVLGNRFEDRSVREAMPVDRRLGNKVVSLTTSLRLGQRVHDPTCGYRAMDASYWNKTPASSFSDSFPFLIEELLAFDHLGAGIREVPISCIYGDEESSLGYVDGLTFLLPALRWRNHREHGVQTE